MDDEPTTLNISFIFIGILLLSILKINKVGIPSVFMLSFTNIATLFIYNYCELYKNNLLHRAVMCVYVYPLLSYLLLKLVVNRETEEIAKAKEYIKAMEFAKPLDSLDINCIFLIHLDNTIKFEGAKLVFETLKTNKTLKSLRTQCKFSIHFRYWIRRHRSTVRCIENQQDIDLFEYSLYIYDSL